MPDMITHDSPLLSLPGEIREMIYDYVFMDPYTHAPKTDILLQRVPHSSPLRCVSKLLRADTAKCYAHAEKLYDERRKETVQSLYEYHEENIEEIASKKGAWYVWRLGNAKHDFMKLCKHACADEKKEGEVGCYMCSDPAHQACFECGRNLFMQYFCETPTFRYPRPTIVFPSSDGNRQTITGRYITSVPQRRVEKIRPGTKSPKPEPSRAWWWWQETADMQKLLAIQCHVRMQAVDQYWRIPFEQRPPFEDAVLSKLERLGKREAWVKSREKYFSGGKPAWRRQFKMLAMERARKEGVSLRAFIPHDFDIAWNLA